MNASHIQKNKGLILFPLNPPQLKLYTERDPAFLTYTEQPVTKEPQ